MSAVPCDAQVTLDDEPHPDVKRAIEAAVNETWNGIRIKVDPDMPPGAWKIVPNGKIECAEDVFETLKDLARVAREGGDDR